MAFILCLAIALLAFYGRPRRRITAMAVLTFAMLVAGCGGGSSTTTTQTPPSTGTYAATVTGAVASGSPSFTLSFTLTVE
jgi:hypothetical protein